MAGSCGHGKMSRVWDSIVVGFDAVALNDVTKQHISFILNGLDVRAFF